MTITGSGISVSGINALQRRAITILRENPGIGTAKFNRLLGRSENSSSCLHKFENPGNWLPIYEEKIGYYTGLYLEEDIMKKVYPGV